MTYKPDPYAEDEEETCCWDCGDWICFEDYMDTGKCEHCRGDYVHVMNREEDEALEYGGVELEEDE